jgi:hypothetical protein
MGWQSLLRKARRKIVRVPRENRVSLGERVFGTGSVLVGEAKASSWEGVYQLSLVDHDNGVLLSSMAAWQSLERFLSEVLEEARVLADGLANESDLLDFDARSLLH